MSEKLVGTTSGMIFTSGKSRIWPLEAPENHLERCENSLREGKEIGKNGIFGYMAYVRRQDIV